MNSEDFKRKLTAILSADVVGYSRLMGENEVATVKCLEEYKGVMFSLIKQYRGRVIDSPGDNLLAEFGSVVDAVQCAVAVQKELHARNVGYLEDRRMQFRIGINLGDVIEEQDRIYGDGVNIAARLEALADPGGICISKTAFDQIESKLPLGYQYLGEQMVKNIAKPISAYRVMMEPRVISREEKGIERASEERMASSFKDKPSIAVLPFVNMSNDLEQEYFSDGMSEEIIGALAKLEGLKVISRTSAFRFKGKDIDLRTIGEKLNVENILEGSVRKAGNKLRISAQLIRVDDDIHLWSETFNRELQDVFAIQDEISQAVVQSLKVKLLGMKTECLVKDYTKNTEAYESYLKGVYIWNKKGFVGFEESIKYLEKSIEVDPGYVPAYSVMATLHGVRTLGQSLAPWDTKPKVNSLLQKALELDDQYAQTYSPLGMSKVEEYDWGGANTYLKRGLELNPGNPIIHITYALYLMSQNRMNEAILEAKHAVSLDPLSGDLRYFLARFLAYEQQFDQAIEVLHEVLELDSNDFWAKTGLGEVYVTMGMYDKAISILQRFRNIPFYATVLGYCYAKAGKKEEAQIILSDFLEREKDGYFSPYFIALVLNGLGDKDKAFEYLDKAYENKDSAQFWIQGEPFLIELHSDPRWVEQLKKRGLAD